MNLKAGTLIGALGLSFALSPIASAQEILPFPPTPSASTAGLTIQDSVYKKRVEPKHLAEGAPNILIILMDDVGPANALDLWRRSQYADARSRGEDGNLLQPLPFDRNVLADACGAAHGPQCDLRR